MKILACSFVHYLSRKFKSYVGLKSAEKKLDRWLNDFTFTDMGTAIENIDWERAPVAIL
ncbi:MAG TPA: hypothetical protein PLA88_03290 [Bacteroidales bacterium]|nr:hypothetical protein [Bacteroidales bacterium]